MKRFFSLLLSLLFPFSIASAEETREFSDSIYSFSYPAAWKQGTAKDGSIVLEVTGTNNGVITFAMQTSVFQFTGDRETDQKNIDNLLSRYSGGGNSSLTVNGTVEGFSTGVLTGYRAPGKWSGVLDAELVFATGEGCMAMFIFVGRTAIAYEQGILDTVRFASSGEVDTEDPNWSVYRGKGVSVKYPSAYASIALESGVIFMKRQVADETVTDVIAVTVYPLNDAVYSPALGLAVAAKNAPAMNDASEPHEEVFGEKTYAVVRGSSEGVPAVYAVTGEGNRALALLIMGEETTAMLDTMLASAQLN